MHIPLTGAGRKQAFLDAVQTIASNWRRGPAVFLGDTNSGWPAIDEQRPVFSLETKRWLDCLAALGWRDAFRSLKADERFYTWYSPNGGNGFRLDQAFVNRGLIGSLENVAYAWGTVEGDAQSRRDILSDHAALILDLKSGDAV